MYHTVMRAWSYSVRQSIRNCLFDLLYSLTVLYCVMSLVDEQSYSSFTNNNSISPPSQRSAVAKGRINGVFPSTRTLVYHHPIICLRWQSFAIATSPVTTIATRFRCGDVCLLSWRVTYNFLSPLCYQQTTWYLIVIVVRFIMTAKTVVRHLQYQ